MWTVQIMGGILPRECSCCKGLNQLCRCTTQNLALVIYTRPPHSGFKMTACVLPKCPFRNKRKRSSRIDFTHRTFAEKGGMLKKARIQKKKVESYWLYTPDFCWKGGVGWNTHMRTLNNTEWGGRGFICKIANNVWPLWRLIFMYVNQNFT